MNKTSHLTTLGYWKIIKPEPFSYGNVYVNGLLGEDNIIVKGRRICKSNNNWLYWYTDILVCHWFLSIHCLQTFISLYRHDNIFLPEFVG